MYTFSDVLTQDGVRKSRLSSSGGAESSTAPSLFKPNVQISRIRLTQFARSEACTGSQLGVGYKVFR